MELITIYGKKYWNGLNYEMAYYKDKECKNLFAVDPWHYHKKDQIIKINYCLYWLVVLHQSPVKKMN